MISGSLPGILGFVHGPGAKPSGTAGETGTSVIEDSTGSSTALPHAPSSTATTQTRVNLRMTGLLRSCPYDGTDTVHG